MEENLKRLENLVERLEKKVEEKPLHEKPHHGLHDMEPVHPEPPHHALHHAELVCPELKKELVLGFKDNKELLTDIFDDEDTAQAVIDIMTTSPVEIQILLKVVMDLYCKVEGK